MGDVNGHQGLFIAIKKPFLFSWEWLFWKNLTYVLKPHWS